jgi:hypothetical protein
MRLLLVHGRDQQGQDPDQLKADWLAALDKGLQKSNLMVDLPFYGDVLDKFARQFELPAEAAVIPRGSPVFDEFHEFRRQVADEMRVRAGITDEQVRAEMGPVTAQERGVENWGWVQAIVRLLDRNFPVRRRPPSRPFCATSTST